MNFTKNILDRKDEKVAENLGRNRRERLGKSLISPEAEWIFPFNGKFFLIAAENLRDRQGEAVEMQKIPASNRQLKTLSAWQSWLVLPILLIAAINTYVRDRVFALLLPRKRYETFIFVPATKAKNAKRGRRESDRNNPGIERDATNQAPTTRRSSLT